MPPLLSAHRARTEISLQATEPNDEPTTPLDLSPDAPPLAWPVAAAVGGLVASLAGWIVAVGLTVVGWLAAPTGTAAGPFGDAVGVGTAWWLLAHGAGTELGGLPVTLIPWGATALFAFLLARCTTAALDWAHRRSDQHLLDDRAGSDRDQVPVDGWRVVVGAATLALLGYLVPVVVLALLHGGVRPGPLVFAGLAAFVAAAGWGSLRAHDWMPTDAWPVWARALPRAVGAGLLVLVAGGAAVVVAGLWRHLDRVSELTQAVDAGGVGTVVLTLAQVAYAPTAAVWGASYALGAGFSLGTGSIVTPSLTELGVLPGLPILGGLPAEGVGADGLLALMLIGVLAGAVAAWIVARSRPAARLDETCLVGGLSGVLTAVALVVLAWAAGGDLGAARLSGLGPRLLPLLVLAGSTLGLAGMAAGLVLGLVRIVRPRVPGVLADLRARRSRTTDDDAEATVFLRSRADAVRPAGETRVGAGSDDEQAADEHGADEHGADEPTAVVDLTGTGEAAPAAAPAGDVGGATGRAGQGR